MRVVNCYRSLVLAALLLSVFVVSGCHRGYYRRQADAEAAALIRQKATDSRWDQVDSSIDVDPQSRMFDPFSYDHPPIPPDDPASHEHMKCAAGYLGYAHWHANGDTNFVENPEWAGSLPLNEDGVVSLDLETSVRLALLHSPDYQFQKEQLFLSALDVALERFGFDAQAAFSWNNFLRTQGRLAPGGSRTFLDFGSGQSRAQISRLGVSGSTLLIGLANSIVWDFAGPDTQTASTLVDFSFIQPLLRGAGRDRIMESLTQAERTLLANVRQMERFRRGFYLQVAIGRNPGQGPSRGGNFLGTPATGNFNAGGFLGLLRTQQEILIAEFNVQQLQTVIDQIRAFYEEERIDLLQVRQTETNLYNAQTTLASDRVNYQTQLDLFKQTLGLPPDIPVVIEDPMLEQFELIDQTNIDRQNDIYRLRTTVGFALASVGDRVREATFDPSGDDEDASNAVRWSDEIGAGLKTIQPYLDRIGPVIDQILEEDVARIQGDFATLESVSENRKEVLEDLQAFVEENDDLYTIEPSVVDTSQVVTRDELEELLEELVGKIEVLKKDFATTEQVLTDLQEEGPELDPERLYTVLSDQVLVRIPDLLTQLSNDMLELSLLQASARTDSINLPTIDIDTRSALCIAREFRRDWMNARASLVDQYRQIEFAADDLESTLDLVFEGDISNDGDNPFRIRYETGRLGIGVRFDAPINRLAERNRYRETLIQYQQAKRNYYQFKDAILQDIRESIRTAELNRILFELNRRQIRISVQGVELSRLRLDEPVQSTGSVLQGGSRLGATTANDITNQLRGLQSAQLAFLRTWVNYEALRRNLDFDLGTMQLTPEGQWIDPGEIDKSLGDRAAEAMGIPIRGCTPEIDPHRYLVVAANQQETGNLEESAPDQLAPQSPGRPDRQESTTDPETRETEPRYQTIPGEEADPLIPPTLPERDDAQRRPRSLDRLLDRISQAGSTHDLPALAPNSDGFATLRSLGGTMEQNIPANVSGERLQPTRYEQEVGSAARPEQEFQSGPTKQRPTALK